MPEPQRILIIRPSALGDVCRTVPVAASLRRAWPSARIDWVVQEEFIEAIRAHPAINDCIAFPRRRLAGAWRSPSAAAELVRWSRSLRERNYDLVLDCQGLGRSGLIALATRAPRRVGLRSARELAWLGYTVRHDPGRSPHTVDQMLALVVGEGLEPVYDMTLYAREEDIGWWAKRRDEVGLGEAPYAVLAPTSRWASKRWPIERWAKLVRPLLDRGFERMVVIGSPGEEAQIAPLAQGLDEQGVAEASVIDIVGQTSVGHTMAVIREAGLVIANDSAPLHMAVGFDRPCVGLFGPTEPRLVGPYRRDESVVRRFMPAPGEVLNFRRLGDGAMRLIETADVTARVDQVLAAPKAAVAEGAAR